MLPGGCFAQTVGPGCRVRWGSPNVFCGQQNLSSFYRALDLETDELAAYCFESGGRLCFDGSDLVKFFPMSAKFHTNIWELIKRAQIG
jgi:hypothetical protein